MTDHETDAASITVHMGSYLMGLRDGAADPGKARRSLEANGPLMDEPGFAEASAEAKRKMHAALARLAVTQPAAAPDAGGEASQSEALSEEVPPPIAAIVECIYDPVTDRFVSITSYRGVELCDKYNPQRIRTAPPVAPVPDAGGWLPIESAPKDGTEVDLWHTSGWRLLNCYWVNSEDGEWRESGWVADWGAFWPDRHITHWRPLPPPPGACAPPVAPASGAGNAGSLELSTDELIDLLTDDEGSAVTLCSKNVDFNGLPNELVIVNACWTDFKDVEFRADTRNECLLLALATLRAAATVTEYLHALLPRGDRP